MAEENEKETLEQEKKELLKEILANIQIDIEADRDNRKMMLDDLKFATLDQWPAELRASRQNTAQPGGARPCLTSDLSNQYLTQVVNEMRQNKPAIKIRPASDKASIETAKIHQGLTRHIEDKSSATIAYENAGEWAAKTGRGYFRVLTEYVGDTFDQEPRIIPVTDAFSVTLGPHIMPDGSDAKRGSITEYLTEAEFKRQFPKAKWETSHFDGLGEMTQTWRKEKTIAVVEHFYIHYEETELFFLANGETVRKDKFDGAEADIVKRRPAQIETVKWVKLSGAEILEERDWLGKYIPIIQVIGKQSVIEGKQTVWGLIRPIKDILRMYNYWLSAITEKIGLAPKAPFIITEGQVEGHELEWAGANKESRPYLTYKREDVNGNATPPPQRQSPAAVETAMIQMMGMIENNVRAALGMYKASVGDSASQQSGRALGLLQKESDTGTFHFADNLSYSIAYLGRILVDLIPKLFDTKRILRIIGEDDTPSSAQIDPSQPEAVRKIQTPNGVKNIYNLGVGDYDVSVTVGPSYTTKRMESAAMYTELARSANDPGQSAVMNYLAIKNSDITSSDEGVKMLKALLPPQVLSVEEGQDPIPPQAMAQIQQMQQQGQMMQQELQKTQEENMQLKSGIQVGMAKVSADNNAKLQAITLDEKVAQEKARIAREEFEFNKQLEIDKANHEIDLAERKAVSAHKLGMDKMDFDQQCRMKDEMGNEAVQILPQMTEAMSNLASLGQVFQNIQDALIKQTEIQTATLAAIERPKSVSIGKVIKDSSGNVTGATVNTTIQ